MRKILAIWLAKLAIIVGKIFGRKGSATPGWVALRIYPDILRALAQQVEGPKIVVCGTNGKTTTNNLLYSILQKTGRSVVCNNLGSNMLEGVVTAFVASTTITGRLRADFATIELDEISTVNVFAHFLPDFIVVTNLFRDQLDRYGEIDFTMEILKKAINAAPQAQLILNADDPLVTSLADSAHTCHFFGVSEQVIKTPKNEVKEGRFCRTCGAELQYDFYHYSQLGHYRCPQCEFVRPNVAFEARNVSFTRGISFDVARTNIFMKYRGFYNIYNILAAVSVSVLIKADLSGINDILAAFKPQIGRMETFDVGKEVVFNLSKNPAGFNQAIQTFLEDDREKSAAIVINDNAQDGRDISWIWDVNFERMRDTTVAVAASGIRHHDLYLRMKYADFNTSFVTNCRDAEQAIRKMLDTKCDVVYVLVNYTALFSTQKILKRLEKNAK